MCGKASEMAVAVETAERRFEVGEEVVIVDATGLYCGFGAVGDKVTVVEDDGTGYKPYRVQNAEGDTHWIEADQLKAAAPEFKVGDRVEMIGNRRSGFTYHNYPIGAIGTLEEVGGESFKFVGEEKATNDMEYQHIYPTDLKLVEAGEPVAPQFKIGDRVEILATLGGSPEPLSHALPVGTIGVVITEPRVSEVHGTLVDVQGDHPAGGGLIQEVSISNLKLADAEVETPSAAEPKAELQFKVGDRVQLANTPSDADYGADGQIVTITEVDEDEPLGCMYKVEDANGRIGWLEAKHVAPIADAIRVGDRVEVFASVGHNFPEGTKETITSTYGGGAVSVAPDEGTIMTDGRETRDQYLLEGDYKIISEGEPSGARKFKVGDKVVAITNPYGVPDGLPGVVKTVEPPTYRGDMVYFVEFDNGTNSWLEEGNFVAPSPEPEPEFKAGDRVEITGDSNGHGFAIGSVVTLRETYPGFYEDEFGLRWCTEEDFHIIVRESDMKPAATEPEKSEFNPKVGDRVVIIAATHKYPHEFPIGTEVVLISDDDVTYDFDSRDDNGAEWYVMRDEIAPLGTKVKTEEEETTVEPEAAVALSFGDRVRVTGGRHFDKVGVIFDGEPDDDGELFVYFDNGTPDGDYDWIDANRVERVDPCGAKVAGELAFGSPVQIIGGTFSGRNGFVINAEPDGDDEIKVAFAENGGDWGYVKSSDAVPAQ